MTGTDRSGREFGPQLHGDFELPIIPITTAVFGHRSALPLPGDEMALSLHRLPLTFETRGKGTPLVFVHTVGTDRRLWHWQHNYFRASHRSIVVDVFGHGTASRLPRGYSLEAAARDIQRLLKELEAKPAVLVGVSMGAAIAMLMAYDAPELVRGLVLLNPWSSIDGHLWGLGKRLFRLAESRDMATYVDLFHRYAFPSVEHLAEIDQLQGLMLTQKPKAVAYAWAACLALNLSDRLERIRVPSLVISGTNDLFIPPYQARRVVQGLPLSDLEFWEGSGHFPFLEDPVRFNNRIEAFVQRCATP
jgi:3-oxoadipate enol-lactonase